MLFNSFAYLVYFPFVVSVYFGIPYRFRNLFLLIMSIVFYMWAVPKYILVIFLTILVDYFAGIVLGKVKKRTDKKIVLLISIISTCLILFIFKYYDFFQDTVQVIMNFIGMKYSHDKLGLELPIGLSFHTFQSLAYVIEVYYGRIKPEKNFLNYSLYVLFFPQLVAGPIERPQNLVDQFRRKTMFNEKNFIEGMKLILIGLLKKCVVADRLADYVNGNPSVSSLKIIS